jgi:hypothetical protein
MLRRDPFDPLHYLERTIRVKVRLREDGRIVLDGLHRLSQQNRRRAAWVLRTYDRLLRLQLDAPKPELRPSVRKLLAQGKLRIVEGKYVQGSAPSPKDDDSPG